MANYQWKSQLRRRKSALSIPPCVKKPAQAGFFTSSSLAGQKYSALQQPDLGGSNAGFSAQQYHNIPFLDAHVR